MTKEVNSSLEYPPAPVRVHLVKNRTLSNTTTGGPPSKSSPCLRLLYEAAVSAIKLEVNLVAFQESTAKAEH